VETEHSEGERDRNENTERSGRGQYGDGGSTGYIAGVCVCLF
jgi:hypothetical protein